MLFYCDRKLNLTGGIFIFLFMMTSGGIIVLYNNICCAVTPTYLLKVTKWFTKISQFEFIVMTDKNIYVYKSFLLLNISVVSLFFMKNCNPSLRKAIPLFFPTNFPLKIKVLSSHPPPETGYAYYAARFSILWSHCFEERTFLMHYLHNKSTVVIQKFRNKAGFAS